MNPRKYLLKYVNANGGPSGSARALNIPYPTMASICNGNRGIGKDLASRMQKASNNELDSNVLIWVKKTKKSNS